MTGKLNKKWVFVEDALGSIKKASKAQVAACDLINLEGAFMQSANEVENHLVKALALLIDDKYGWLDWFVYDNDFGEKSLNAGLENEMKPIKTLGDLKALIETGVR